MAGRALLPPWLQWLRSLGQGEGGPAGPQAGSPARGAPGRVAALAVWLPLSSNTVWFPNSPQHQSLGGCPCARQPPPRSPGPTDKELPGLQAHLLPRTGAGHVGEMRSCQETPGARAPGQGSRSPSEGSPAVSLPAHVMQRTLTRHLTLGQAWWSPVTRHGDPLHGRCTCGGD